LEKLDDSVLSITHNVFGMLFNVTLSVKYPGELQLPCSLIISGSGTLLGSAASTG